MEEDVGIVGDVVYAAYLTVIAVAWIVVPVVAVIAGG
jgi:hypothetical protein